MSEIPRNERWPGYETEDGHAILPSPSSYREVRMHPCNAPYKINGTIVGYCSVLVPDRTELRRFRKSKFAGKHTGRHMLTWKNDFAGY